MEKIVNDFICNDIRTSMMNKVVKCLLLLSAAMLMSCAEQDTEPSHFKMIIRLWESHHNDSIVSRQLLDALRKYPNFCDEVWFCTDQVNDFTMEELGESAKRMGHMADEMRKLGILPSIQTICIGHPEGNAVLESKTTYLDWGTVVGPGGQKTRYQSCPRQEKFHKRYAEAYGLFAKACQPYGFWLDDDYRLTSHFPADAICYCDDCIATFNSQNGYQFDREGLVEALNRNEGQGMLRKQWIAFCQEGLATFAAAVSKAIHENSPKTHMGLQHVMFHRALLEGYDWNKTFDAMERETGLVPLSRPGNGYYDDHSPRGMLGKGLDIARQIRRLNKNIVEIAPEIEGYFHKSTGKSPHGVCVETMYYLAMGATQMSYALICSGQEPMEWYADNYFKSLQRWHEFAKDYADFNFGTEPGGINPYISPNHVYRNVGANEPAWNWTATNAQTCIYDLAPLGIPFCPDGNVPTAIMLDGEVLTGMSDAEVRDVFSYNGIVVDTWGWNALKERNLVGDYTKVAAVEGMLDTECYETRDGQRLVVVDGFGADVNIKQRNSYLKSFDWASHELLPVVMETMSQSAVVPRVDEKGCLHSVALLNCSISEQEGYTLRLRLDKNVKEAKTLNKTFVWKKNGCKDVRLKPKYEGRDVVLNVPNLEGWNFGWIAIK